MQNVVLIIHLILAVFLIAVVLLQRSEGGALGIGGGGGGTAAGRSALSPLAKVTWGLAIAFIATSITLTILAGGREEAGSILDRFSTEPGNEIPLPGPAGENELLVPPPASDGPATPPAAD